MRNRVQSPSSWVPSDGHDGVMADFDLTTVIECASLAPSVHNTQPWGFSMSGSSIEVLAEPARRLDYLDPTSRLLHVSCGAAIEFAWLAVRAMGRQCDVHVLPDPARPELLARLDVGGEQATTPLEVELADAIPRRYTDRGPYDDRALPPQVLIDVQTRCAELGVWVRLIEDRADRTTVATILAEAESREAADSDYANELRRWTSPQAAEVGVPAEAVPPWPADRVSDMPLRDFTGHGEHPRPGGEDAPPRVERDTLLLLGTALDDRAAWLASGRALGWLLLRATAESASAQPLGPAIDLPDSRAALRRELGLVGHPQFLLRMGFGSGEPRTRRQLDQQLS